MKEMRLSAVSPRQFVLLDTLHVEQVCCNSLAARPASTQKSATGFGLCCGGGRSEKKSVKAVP